MSNKYNSICIDIVQRLYFFPSINYEKIDCFNTNNSITNFNFSYIIKKNPIYEVFTDSLFINRTDFSVYKNESIFLSSIKKIDNNEINNSINSTIKKVLPNTEAKTKNFPGIIIENKTIKVITTSPKTKPNNNIIRQTKYLNYSKSKAGNLLLTASFKQNKNNINNNNINSSITINHNNKNQINKESNKGDSTESDKSRFLDERGLYISGDGSIYDNDGTCFNNEDGLDEHGGKYNKFGEYINGANFNANIGMYDDEIKNCIFNDENQLKKEVEERQKIEFEKIKNEAIKSKKLIKNYYRPYEKNNSSSSDEDSYDEEELINEALNNEENEKNEYYNELMEKEKKNSNDLKQISQINATFEENMKEDSPIDEIKNTNVKNNKYNKKKSNDKKKTIKVKRNYKKKKKQVITEESINNETDFTDIENSIFIRKILDKYHLCQEDKEEAINCINELFLSYQNKK